MITGIVTRLAVERDTEMSFFGTEEGKKWLADALELSKATSIPSVENLNTKPSYWFILIDAKLDTEIQLAILETFSVGTTIPIRLVLADGWGDSSDALMANSDAEMCDLQIRLDYDDMLHKFFIDQMQSVASLLEETRCLISPLNGISFDLRRHRIAQIRKKSPPFLALHRTERFRKLSILSFEHDKWPEDLVHELHTYPLWMQIITGKNISNRFGRGWLVESCRHLKSINLKFWTGDSTEVFNSASCIVLRNTYEYVFELALALKDGLKKLFPSRTNP